MTAACDGCLRRAHLLGHLAPRIAGVLGEPGARRRSGLLALSDAELIAAACDGRRAEHALRFTEAFDPDAARSALAAAGVEGACRHGAGYPAGLRELADPPAVLFVRGGAARLTGLAAAPAVTIVGTRSPSSYGLEVARALGRDLSLAGVTVVSGLALGIDAAAHRGALEGGGRAIAVLARGPERAYPRTNARLYERLLAGGCVVSELPPGSPVYRWAFPARNRIMAALGAVTAVVEADDPSGTLITTRFAEDLGRTVAAVPGRITTRAARGANRLLRDGARVVLESRDLLEEVLGPGWKPPSAGGPPSPIALDGPLAAVLDALDGEATVTAIADRTGHGAASVRAALGRLELLGLVRREGLAYERSPVPAYPPAS